MAFVAKFPSQCGHPHCKGIKAGETVVRGNNGMYWHKTCQEIWMRTDLRTREYWRR